MGQGGSRPAGGRKTGNGENWKAGNGIARLGQAGRSAQLRHGRLARLGQVRKGFGIRAENGQTRRLA